MLIQRFQRGHYGVGRRRIVFLGLPLCLRIYGRNLHLLTIFD